MWSSSSASRFRISPLEAPIPDPAVLDPAGLATGLRGRRRRGHHLPVASDPPGNNVGPGPCRHFDPYGPDCEFLRRNSTKDYIRTARAKGLSETAVVYRHALRNALIPVLTVIGLQFGSLLAGAIVTETIFSWPGIGRLTLSAISNRDYAPWCKECMSGGRSHLCGSESLLTDIAYTVANHAHAWQNMPPLERTGQARTTRKSGKVSKLMAAILAYFSRLLYLRLFLRSGQSPVQARSRQAGTRSSPSARQTPCARAD